MTAAVRPLNLPITTPRLQVRKMQRADLEPFMAYRADPDVARFQGWTAMDRASSLAFIDEMAGAEGLEGGRWLQLGIADRESGALLGDIGLHPDTAFAELEIGFTLAAAHQRRGLATEAVDAVLNEAMRAAAIPRARAVTDARNASSIVLLQRLGFRRDRELRSVFRGEPCVEYVYLLEGLPTRHG